MYRSVVKEIRYDDSDFKISTEEMEEYKKIKFAIEHYLQGAVRYSGQLYVIPKKIGNFYYILIKHFMPTDNFDSWDEEKYMILSDLRGNILIGLTKVGESHINNINSLYISDEHIFFPSYVDEFSNDQLTHYEYKNNKMIRKHTFSKIYKNEFLPLAEQKESLFVIYNGLEYFYDIKAAKLSNIYFSSIIEPDTHCAKGEFHHWNFNNFKTKEEKILFAEKLSKKLFEEKLFIGMIYFNNNTRGFVLLNAHGKIVSNLFLKRDLEYSIVEIDNESFTDVINEIKSISERKYSDEELDEKVSTFIKNNVKR